MRKSKPPMMIGYMKEDGVVETVACRQFFVAKPGSGKITLWTVENVAITIKLSALRVGEVADEMSNPGL